MRDMAAATIGSAVVAEPYATQTVVQQLSTPQEQTLTDAGPRGLGGGYPAAAAAAAEGSEGPLTRTRGRAASAAGEPAGRGEAPRRPAVVLGTSPPPPGLVSLARVASVNPPRRTRFGPVPETRAAAGDGTAPKDADTLQVRTARLPLSSP